MQIFSAGTSDKRETEKITSQKKAWRQRQNLPEHGTGGKSSGKTAVTELVKRTYYKNRKPNKYQETIKQRLEDNLPEKCGPGRWPHDLTEEGVEPHPGPCHHKHRKQTDFAGLSMLQLNIDPWKLKGWKLLNEAEKANIDILCLQEMKIQQGEAQALNGSLRNWQLFYQSELDTNRSNGREGGVAIFIKKNIAATQAKAFHSEGGQWIRVTCPGFNIVSVYRRPKLSKMLADTFDESLGQDLATVSNIPFLAVGDFNQDPLTFGKSRFPQAQILCPTQDSSESDVETQIPEPTRWDGTVCLDWGLCHDVQCNVVTKENKWSDHKLPHWSIPHIGISRIRIRKIAPRPNLAKPENVTQDRWNDVLRQNGICLRMKSLRTPLGNVFVA